MTENVHINRRSEKTHKTLSEIQKSFIEDEVRSCISSLPDGKAGGIPNEILKCTSDIITPVLTSLGPAEGQKLIKFIAIMFVS